MKPGTIASEDIDLKCKGCKKETVVVTKGKVVPYCSNCGEKTNWSIKG